MADDKSYLPDPKNVIEVITFHLAAMAAAAAKPALPPPTFRILRTNELDPYEKRKTHANIAASAIAPAAVSENFAGTARRKAKLSISSANMETFAHLSDLLGSLVKDSDMVKHQPKITTDAASDRVNEEQRNVSVSVWLYAASRESDNDFHVILGRDPAQMPRRYMNAEVSGLPPANSNSSSKLVAARSSFKAIVQQQTPGAGYDFYDPPIPLTVQGSLFFDMTHAKGPKPGPSSTKPGTIWEIHPITSIKP
jgi:hypothetical protein